jgi:CHAT domain
MNTVMEIEIGPGTTDESYTVRVLRSVGGGEPSATFELDVDEILARRPQLEESVLASSVRARRIMTDREVAIQELGTRLFEAVFQGTVEVAYRTSLAVASERGRGLQLVLRLTAPGLAALPWESLYDAETGTYLCRKEPLVRQVPAPYTQDALDFDPPLRILGMVAAPFGLQHLDVEAEQRRLDDALRPYIDGGVVELHWLDDVSWAGVHAALLGQSWHVLHFIGHGGYDTETDEGVLALVGTDGRADFVTAGALADLLAEADPVPRLVVLNSCESGTSGTSDLFSGTAAALVHNGMHAVAAMQFAVTDTAAIAFARAFYTALAYGRGIDEAMRSGRIGMLGTGRGTLEWVTPVLYLRGNDTQLFELTRPVRQIGAGSQRGPGPQKVEPPAVIAAVRPEQPVAPLAPPIDHGAPDLPTARSSVDGTEEPTAVDGGAATAPPGFGPTLRPPSAPPPHVPEPPSFGPPTPMTAPGQVAEPGEASSQPDRTAEVPGPGAGAVIDTVESPSGPSAPAQPSDEPGAPAPPPDEPGGPAPPPEPGGPAPPPEPKRSAWKLWLIIGVISILAIAGGATALIIALQPRSTVEPNTPSASEPSTTPPVETPDAEVNPAVVVTVPGDERWTETGFVCAPGDVYGVTATGNVSFEGDPTGGVDPDGAPPMPDGTYDPNGNLPGLENTPHRGLIGSVEGADLFFVGSEATVTCPNEGRLLLGVNDVGISDNLGEFVATVTPAG